MSYESWRISYQSSEAAARAAYATTEKLHAELTALREQMAAIGAGGVEPLRKARAASAETKISALMSKISTLVDKRLSCEPCAEAEEDLLQFIRTWYAAPTYLAEGATAQTDAQAVQPSLISTLERIALKFASAYEAAGRETYREDTEKQARKAKQHLTTALQSALATRPTTQGLDALEPQVPDDFLAVETKPFGQLHVGRDHKGDRVWHTNSEGTFWCGDWRSRTPAELERECLSTVKDLRAIAAQAKQEVLP